MSIVDLPENEPWRPSGRSAAAAAEAEARRIPEELVYVGRRWRVFALALSRMIVTILTLGIGRFWMTTRLRRHYWSSLEIGGAPLEYTGTALEKLLGFLIAIAILAVYLVAVNLALTFIGLSFFQGNPLALQLPLLALLPLAPWAQYRARRYILARTRWRGIRFGMTPGAWGYAGRAMLWGFVALITLGLLYPLMQIKLSRFATNRSFYGDLRFEQRGALGPLMKSWLWVWLPLPLLMIAIGVAAISSIGGDGAEAGEIGLAALSSEGFITAASLVGAVAYVWIFFAFIRHRVFSFRYLNSNKVLGERTRFAFRLSTWKVIRIYIFGGLLTNLGMVLFAALSTAVAVGLMSATGLDPTVIEDLVAGGAVDSSAARVFALMFAAYLPAIAAFVAFGHAFITHPLVAATAASTEVRGLEAAGRARQRAHDEQAEAGGFADALGADVGGAF